MTRTSASAPEPPSDSVPSAPASISAYSTASAADAVQLNSSAYQFIKTVNRKP
ncbi:MAG: hypothetical protein ACJ754_06400 [Pyrinomonadaceae bacterium]